MGSVAQAADHTTRVFVADYYDAAPKGEINFMEYPLFSLSKRPDLEIYRYENKNNGVWLEVAPSLYGRANIYDKDLLLYCTGQIWQARNNKEPVSRRVRITAYDYLEATHRGTGGKDYKSLHDSLARLRGTTFKSNLYNMGGREVYGLIDEAELLCDENGRMTYIDVVIGQRMFDAILQKKILTYNQAYFSLSPNERRTYELVRKHCGKQSKWKISIDALHTKFGTRSETRKFRQTVNKLVRDDRIPDYTLELDTIHDLLIARPSAS